MNNFAITCTDDVAGTLAGWLAQGRGVSKWGSLNLSDPGRTWLTPAFDLDGTPTRKPHWGATSEPTVTVTDPEQIGVEGLVEVKRFHVAIRRASNGPTLKLTDASSNKIWKALDSAGPGSSYAFDYSTQEAVIYVPKGEPVSLTTWKASVSND